MDAYIRRSLSTLNDNDLVSIVLDGTSFYLLLEILDNYSHIPGFTRLDIINLKDMVVRSAIYSKENEKT